MIHHAPFGIFYLVIYILIVFLITFWVSFLTLQNVVSKDRETYKCNLMLTGNLKECIAEEVQPLLSEYINQKFYNKFDKARRDNISKSRELETKKTKLVDDAHMQNGLFAKIFEKYENVTFVFNYLAMKLDHIFKKGVSLAWFLYYSLLTQVNVLVLQITLVLEFLDAAQLYMALIPVVNQIAFILIALQHKAREERKCR